MTPEEKSLLERTHKLAEENNEILRGIRRSNRISAVFRVIYWIIIIGIGVGTFYFLQPYLYAAADVVRQGQNVLNNVRDQINR
jgi:hypothetical protein